MLGKCNELGVREVSMEYVVKVQGMSCGHCVRAITQALQALAPDAEVSVDLAAGTVAVNASLSLEQVLGAIDEQGFEASAA